MTEDDRGDGDRGAAGVGETVGGEVHRRRRRRRATAPQGPPVVAGPGVAEPEGERPGVAEPGGERAAGPAAADSADDAVRAAKTEKTRAPRRPSREGPADRGLRDLVGAGHSQVGVGGALRARDVNRPTEDDLAEAEVEVEIVRRNWKPRADG